MISTPEELQELRRLAQRVIDVRTALEHSSHQLGAYEAFDNAVADLQARLSPDRLVSLLDAHQRLGERLAELEAKTP